MVRLRLLGVMVQVVQRMNDEDAALNVCSVAVAAAQEHWTDYRMMAEIVVRLLLVYAQVDRD